MSNIPMNPHHHWQQSSVPFLSLFREEFGWDSDIQVEAFEPIRLNNRSGQCNLDK